MYLQDFTLNGLFSLENTRKSVRLEITAVVPTTESLIMTTRQAAGLFFLFGIIRCETWLL